eukprot:TRINITY_DN2744_c0_g1_i3.p1 TRINITY_DN2744_c0_g1~~TRINITY_DN2744_c0_g1_i3.p1  ORF type:complete len:256 (+),score=-52.66 TRINITY_DN2744_c0_g1_i3:73-768(+)
MCIGIIPRNSEQVDSYIMSKQNYVQSLNVKRISSGKSGTRRQIKCIQPSAYNPTTQTGGCGHTSQHSQNIDATHCQTISGSKGGDHTQLQLSHNITWRQTQWWKGMPQLRLELANAYFFTSYLWVYDYQILCCILVLHRLLFQYTIYIIKNYHHVIQQWQLQFQSKAFIVQFFKQVSSTCLVFSHLSNQRFKLFDSSKQRFAPILQYGQQNNCLCIVRIFTLICQRCQYEV